MKKKKKKKKYLRAVISEKRREEKRSGEIERERVWEIGKTDLNSQIREKERERERPSLHYELRTVNECDL